MLKNFNRIYAQEINLNNLETTYATSAIYGSGDKNTSTLIVRVLNGADKFDLTNCTITALFKCADGKIYKQDTTILDPEDGSVGIDLKTDVLQVGTNTIALKIINEDLDIIYTPSMSYKVVTTITDGIDATDDRVSVIESILNEVEITKEQIKEMENQLAIKISEFDEEYQQFLQGIRTEIDELKSSVKNGETPDITIGTVTTLGAGENATVENVGTQLNPILNFGIPQGEKGDSGTFDASNFYTKSETDNKITEELNNKVDKEDGKGLSTNDYTTVEKIKLNNIEENANNYVHPSNHSASMITQDETHRFVTDVEKNIWNNKLDENHNHDNNYATKSSEHNHTNKEILDVISQEKITSWDNKSDFNGSYNSLTDKPIIPSIEGLATKIELNNKVDKEEGKSLIEDVEIQRLKGIKNYDDSEVKASLESKANKTDLHSHSNKEILDSITQDKINQWNNGGSSEDNSTIPKLSTICVKDASGNSILTLDFDLIPKDKSTVYLNDVFTEAQGDGALKIRRDGIDNTLGTLTTDYMFVTVSYKTSYNKLFVANTRNAIEFDFNTNRRKNNNLSSLSGKPDKTNVLTLDNTILYTPTQNYHPATKKYVDEQCNDIAKDLLLEDRKLYLKKSDGNKIGDGVVLPVSGSITWEKVTGKPATFTPSSHSHSKSDITDFPTIPTKTSQLTNDSGYLTEHQDISGKADKTELHSHSNKSIIDSITSSKVTEWNNKSTFSGNYNDLTNKPNIPTVDVTKSYVDAQLALKSDIHEHPYLSQNTVIPSRLSQLENDSRFATETFTTSKISEKMGNLSMQKITQSEYDAISNKNANCLYIIVG